MKKKMIILIIISMIILSGLNKVKAATSGLDKYDYRFWPVSCNLQGNNCILGPSSGFLNNKEYYDLTPQYSSIVQFNLRTWAGSNTYKANNTYTFRYTVQVADKTTLLDNLELINKSVKLIDMYTATSSSPNNAIQEDIDVNIKFTDATGSTDKIYLYIKFIPSSDIKWWGVTFQIGKLGGKYNDFPFSDMQKIRYINTVVTYEEGAGAIIDKKTDEIIKEQEKTNEILSKDHNYNNDASINTEEDKNKFDNYEKQEESLKNGLNLNIEDSQITIDPNANDFVWETINKLRSMSPKIVLLFTSVLSLGLMKMILGR